MALSLTDIGIGATANDGNGDTLRAGATTVNANNALVQTEVNDKHSLHHTTGHPANSVGENEDWCINDTTGELVGPKGGGTWPATATGYGGLAFAELVDDLAPQLGASLGLGGGFPFTATGSGSSRVIQFDLTDVGAGFQFTTADNLDAQDVIFASVATNAAHDIDLVLRAQSDGKVKIDDLQNEAGAAYLEDGKQNEPALFRGSGNTTVTATTVPATGLDIATLVLDGNGSWSIDSSSMLHADAEGDFLFEADLEFKNTDAADPAWVRIFFLVDEGGGTPGSTDFMSTPFDAFTSIAAEDADHAGEYSRIAFKRPISIGTGTDSSPVGTTIQCVAIKDGDTADPIFVGATSYFKMTRIGPDSGVHHIVTP